MCVYRTCKYVHIDMYINMCFYIYKYIRVRVYRYAYI